MYKILLVEDELIELEALKKIINKGFDGIKVFEASKGTEAIQLIDQLDHIDLILVDINIPLPNGLEVIRYLREKSTETKVIVTTANDDIDLVRHMFGLKVDDYLLKPIKPQVLINTIKNSLEFNEQKSHEIKQKKVRMGQLLDHGQYIEWNNLIIDSLSKQYYCSATEDNQEISNLLDILHQITNSRGWVIELLHKHESFLTNLKLNKSNYYKVLSILLEISNHIFDIACKASGKKLTAIQRAQYYIEQNILKEISLDSVAENSYISSCYLSRLFKKEFGMGFSEYIAKRKIVLAQLLLRFSDLQINTIALELAYNDANYFCRLFKKETGTSPSEYRRHENKLLEPCHPSQ